MPNPAYLVEGHMEQRFLANICTGQPVRRIGCNGDQVSMKGIAKHLDTHIRLLRRNYPIIIIFDRERRESNCQELASELTNELFARGIDVCNLVLGIADRTIENWILSDPVTLDAFYPGRSNCYCADGKFGKSILAKSLAPVEAYNETTTGVELLRSMNPQEARLRSPSLDRFLDQLELPCWWLNR